MAPATARVMAAGVGLGALATAYALWEARNYTLRHVLLPVLPEGSPDVTLLHMSDLHLAPRDRDRISWIESLEDLGVDAVVLTGDLISGPRGLPLLLEAMQPFAHVPGMFVFGSNDYFAAIPKNPAKYFRGPSRDTEAKQPDLPWQDLAAGLEDFGWANLNNARGRLSVRGLDLDVRGVDDPHIHRDRYDEVAGPFDAAATTRIGVTHAPYRRTLNAMAADGADLIVAGHTHGGQVCLPGYGALVTNCDLDRGRAKGLSRWPIVMPDGRELSPWLNVSAGLGTSPFTPIRIACRPEATLLSLVAREV